MHEELETFLAQVEAQTGSGLPQFVKDEFEAYLECGILAHGFLRVRCNECAHEKLVAFSCKRRGFCPSCGARRVPGTAVYLVDRVRSVNVCNGSDAAVRHARKQTVGILGTNVC